MARKPKFEGDAGGDAPANPANRVGLDDPARPGESQVFRSQAEACAAAEARPASVPMADRGGASTPSGPLSSATTAVPPDDSGESAFWRKGGAVAPDDLVEDSEQPARPTDPGLDVPEDAFVHRAPRQMAPKAAPSEKGGLSRVVNFQNAVIAAIAAALVATNWDGLSRVVLEKTDTLSGLLDAYKAIAAEKDEIRDAYDSKIAWIDETWEPGELTRIAAEREEKLAVIEANQQAQLDGVDGAVQQDIAKIESAANSFRAVVAKWDSVMQGEEGSPENYKAILSAELNGRSLPGYGHIMSASDAYLTLDDEGVYELDLSAGVDGVHAQAAAHAARVESALVRLQAAKDAAYVSIGVWKEEQLAGVKSAAQRRATIINAAVAARKGVDTWEQGQLDELAAGKGQYQETFTAERDQALEVLPGLLDAQVGSKGVLVEGFLGGASPIVVPAEDCLSDGEKADQLYCDVRAKSILDCDDPANTGLTVAEIGCENRYAEYLTTYACGAAAPVVVDKQAWMDSRVLSDGYTMPITPRTLCERAQKGTWAVDAIKTGEVAAQ